MRFALILMSTMGKVWHRLQLIKYQFLRKSGKNADDCCQFETDKWWFNLYPNDDGLIKKPDELESYIENPPGSIDEKILDKIQGSLIGMAVGDALGAHAEFRPREYLLENPVKNLKGGGTWGLEQGQFTDDTSMALCLAISLIVSRGFVPYHQLVRYKWWYQYGYMSSTGECFDIGAATKKSLNEFMRRQQIFAKKYRIPINNLDQLSDLHLLQKFDVDCSKSGVAGNGALMRLAPVPLFFYQHIEEAIAFSGYSAKTTHGDKKAVDACRYYGALIIAALHNFTKDELLDRQFLEKHRSWFGDTPICDEVRTIAEGSYQKQGGYDDGIRGRGYIVDALEAALWAFWSDENSFEKGVLAAVNLGDDTDTTAAIYGQLAGAFYGYKNVPKKWVNQICGHEFILKVGKWIAYEGQIWEKTEVILPTNEALFHDFRRAASTNDILSDDTVEAPPIRRPRMMNVKGQIRRHSMYDRSVLASNTHSPSSKPNGLGSTIANGDVPIQEQPINNKSKNPFQKLFKKKERSPTDTWTPKLKRKNPVEYF